MRIILSIFIIAFYFNANAQYNVKEFGAKGDGKTLDTHSIQNAIDKAYENGGGVVEVPAGTYKIGTLILKDNINLHVQAGAVLLGSPDYNDYTEINQKFESRTNGLYAKTFMIFAEDAKYISITGEGTINGNGVEHFQETKPQNRRPYLIRLVNCEKVILKDIHLMESANWTLHLLGCKDVNVDGVFIQTTAEGNRDGLDIDACQRVTVSNCKINTTDDAIVMKASCDVMCQDITITNCILRSAGSAIKTGTESNGGFKNITVSNCVVKDIKAHTGIELMTVDGGIMQNIVIDNITMENVVTPIYIRIGLRSRPYKKGQYVNQIGDVKSIHLNNISVLEASRPSSIMGLHHKRIENISITNYSVKYTEKQEAIAYNKVPYEEFSYPMAKQFKNLPAYGLYCRNVNELYLSNINIKPIDGETRSALTFDRVSNLELFSVKAEVKDNTNPLVYFRNADNVVTGFCRTIDMSNTLFVTEDNNCSNMHFTNSILHPGQKEVKIVDALNDEQLFNDIDAETKYSVDNKNEKINGFPAHDLKEPLNVKLEVLKNKSMQIRLLVLNESSKPEEIIVKYNGVEQKFIVDWNKWGWASITLIKEYNKDKKIDFEIVASDKNTALKIAKVYMTYQNITYTD